MGDAEVLGVVYEYANEHYHANEGRVSVVQAGLVQGLGWVSAAELHCFTDIGGWAFLFVILLLLILFSRFP